MHLNISTHECFESVVTKSLTFDKDVINSF